MHYPVIRNSVFRIPYSVFRILYSAPYSVFCAVFGIPYSVFRNHTSISDISIADVSVSNPSRVPQYSRYTWRQMMNAVAKNENAFAMMNGYALSSMAEVPKQIEAPASRRTKYILTGRVLLI